MKLLLCVAVVLCVTVISAQSGGKSAGKGKDGERPPPPRQDAARPAPPRQDEARPTPPPGQRENGKGKGGKGEDGKGKDGKGKDSDRDGNGKPPRDEPHQLMCKVELGGTELTVATCPVGTRCSEEPEPIRGPEGPIAGNAFFCEKIPLVACYVEIGEEEPSDLTENCNPDTEVCDMSGEHTVILEHGNVNITYCSPKI